MALKILAADRSNPLEYFEKKAAAIGAEVVYGGAERPEQIESLVEDVDAVIVFRTHVTETAIERMKQFMTLSPQVLGRRQGAKKPDRRSVGRYDVDTCPINRHNVQ